MPSTQKQWTVADTNGFDGLKLATDAPVPKIGEKDVLVKRKSPSLPQSIISTTKTNTGKSTAPPSTTATSPSSKASTPSPSATA